MSLKTLRKLVVTVLLMSGVGLANAADSDDVETMLHEFLAAAHLELAHATFWAEDLIYTSSDGSRSGKAEIMAGFDGAQGSDEAPAMVYSGEDVTIRVFDDTAVATFKLVGTPTDKSTDEVVLYYFNTGTFLKRDGVWQVVAWQATKIPPK
jgi:hypothetical protein